ncbi:MAG TPA: hypothetical protein VMM60_10240 [Ilumatobacter sp.]|nr:hypothetical protein [Ilumatobacter sp.]
MLFWLVGTAVLTVWFVFRDPRFDYRLLIVGSLMPAIVDALFGGARVLHSVTFSVALLVLLMAVTAGRKPIRKTLLGLPVGTMLYLVFSGAWTNTTVFWWPFFGLDFGGAPHPIAERGWWNVLLEIIGLGVCWWIVQHANLRTADRRRHFWRTGQLAFV